MILKGKSAVVTGGTSGLGRVVADALAAEGASVLVASRSADESGDAVAADVTDPAAVARLMRIVRDRFGGLDILVANAGASRPGPVASLPAEAWQEVLSTNVTGVLHCVQAAVPLLRESGSGRIITMSSVLGQRPMAGAAAYCASKAGLEMLTKVCAVELAGDGITANCISPGVIDEGMGRALMAYEPVWSKMRGSLAMGRPGSSDEVARAAVFLASADSSYVNGHVLQVDGGLGW